MTGISTQAHAAQIFKRVIKRVNFKRAAFTLTVESIIHECKPRFLTVLGEYCYIAYFGFILDLADAYRLGAILAIFFLNVLIL